MTYGNLAKAPTVSRNSSFAKSLIRNISTFTTADAFYKQEAEAH